jgi:2-alkenal reductase
MSLPVEQGAYVSLVTDNGPSKAAGLVGSTGTITQDGREVEIGGDVITAIDGQPINTFDELLVYLSLQTSPGQEVTLTILRDGQTQEITLPLGSRPIE